MTYNILFVALGGALGSVARYLVSEWMREASDSAFPLGTLLVNVPRMPAYRTFQWTSRTVRHGRCG